MFAGRPDPGVNSRRTVGMRGGPSMTHEGRRRTFPSIGLLLGASVIAGAPTAGPPPVVAQPPAATAAEITFSKDISRILQRSCQECHHAEGVAPMALVTY